LEGDVGVIERMFFVVHDCPGHGYSAALVSARLLAISSTIASATACLDRISDEVALILELI
jgi:hypothetical protein